MNDISEIVRAKLRSGALRQDKHMATWAGKGEGRPCVGCDRPIHDSDVEIEAEFSDAQLLRFHFLCFDCWCSETRGWPPPRDS